MYIIRQARWLFAIFNIIPFLSVGQETSPLQPGIEMHIEYDSPLEKGNLISATVELLNKRSESFQGYLQINTPNGFKSILGNLVDVRLDAGQKKFLPVKLLIQGTANAGESILDFRLLDRNKKSLLSQTLGQQIKENNNMSLRAEAPILYQTNPNDSLAVAITVSNLGNRTQAVNMVFHIPDLIGEVNFFEQKGLVSMQKDTTFIFRFRPSAVLLNQAQFTVNITGLRGSEKVLFGNTSVTIQNVSSSKQYNSLESNISSALYQRNSVTASYRKIGQNTDIYQLVGSAVLNLPAGYLSARANIYQAKGQSLPIITNTYLAYQLDNNEVKIGTISEPLELSLFGRGTQVKIADQSNDKNLEIGFVDQNYNLIGQEAFLQNGYGIFARGIIHASNPTKNIVGTYIFKDDPIEQARHQILSGEIQRTPNKDWNIHFKLHGGLSNYITEHKDAASFASEAQYRGLLGNNTRISGNYYYSTDYFPGNRRGTFQLQQNINRRFKNNYSLYGSIFLSNIAPKSYSLPINWKTKSLRTDVGLTFPNLNRISFGINVQHQEERSNSYYTISQGLNLRGDLSLQANRFVETASWTSTDQNHSLFLSLENGQVSYPEIDQNKFQSKITSTYAYKWFNFNSSFQHGSYYLSEYVSSVQAGHNFERLLLSASVNKNLLHDQLWINSGFSYTRDYISGKTPSTFLNFRYSPKENYFFYMNSNWYRYQYQFSGINIGRSNANMLTMEVGVTVNFRGKSPFKGRKSTVTTKVYYDNNSNNVYDEGDQVASDYFLTLNNTSFKTDSTGKFVYKSVPFGSYQIKSSTEKGWSSKEGNYSIDQYKTRLEIPLHQNGTIRGKIQYDYDSRTVLDFEPKINGIAFIIRQNTQFVQRIATDNLGNFTAFLPTGQYEVELDEGSLAHNTFCEGNHFSIKAESGKITEVPTFIIKVKQKKINIKRFGQ